MNNNKIKLLLNDNKEVRDFLGDTDEFEILKKIISGEELKRIRSEYPNLLKLEKPQTIICITLVKRDSHVDNRIHLKKIKLYIDETSEKIIKILQN